jgi:protein-disulfide isomerase
MKKKFKDLIITGMIILAVILLAFFLINRDNPETTEEIAKCIGSKAVLYTQLGCHACEIQVDCFYEREECTEIMATPTWIIKNKKYEGVQSIEKLQELTGC